jgi:aspartyl-tRNA(Asn)/glutamyl-tRNA(Gln) amidotransferase subunit A
VAVAARLVAASFGSDTGGSVRLPAAACGVFGLLPTNGRVPRHGMLPLSHSLDCAGPLARSARDLARVLGVVAGQDPDDASSSAEPVTDYEAGIEAGIAGLTVGFATNYYPDEIDADTAAMMDAVSAVLAEAGGNVAQIEVPDPRPLDALGNLLILAEAASYHRDDLRDRGDEYTPLVRERIRFGFSFDAVSYIDALRLRAIELKRFLAAVFTRADVLVLPTLPHAAPAFADVERALAGAADLSFPLAKFTRSINYLGLPAVSVPAGLDRRGLPLAFQVVGRPFDEALILRVARGFETARPSAMPDIAEPV